MITIEIEIKEKGNNIVNSETCKADIECGVSVMGQDETIAERKVSDIILKKAGLDKKFALIDNTKDKRYKELEEILEKLSRKINERFWGCS